MKKIVLPLIVAALGAVSTQATGILNEAFNYPTGTLTMVSGGLWSAHSGAGSGPVSVNSNTVTSNLEIRMSGGNNEDVNRGLNGAPYDTTNNPGVLALYASLKVRVTSTPGAAGNYFAHFKDDGTVNFRCRVFVLTNGTATGGTFRFGIGSTNSASGSAGFVSFPSDLSLNTSNMVVVRIDLNTGHSTLWLNPTADTDPSVESGADPGTIIPVTTFAFRQASGIGVLFADDLRVGTSFADVAGPNDPPSISSIPDQRVPVGGSTPTLPFTVGDAESAAGALTVTGSSSDQGVVLDGDIALGGSDSNRTVMVTPTGGQQGTAQITITVTDEGGVSASESFQVLVGIPTISDVPNQTTPINTVLGPINFTVGDTETPAGSLTVTATSSNPALLTDGNVMVGGSGANRTLTITPETDQTGLTTITVTVSDGTSSAIETFVLTVYPILGLVRTDDFNRPDGPLVGDGTWISNGGVGGAHSGETQITGNRLKLSSAQSEDLRTDMPVFTGASYAPASGTILYAGMMVRFIELPTANGSYFAHFQDDTVSGFRCRVIASRANAASGRFRVGVANNAAAVSASGQFPRDLGTNESHFIVVRYNVGTGESRLWLDPVSESSLSIGAADSPSAISIFFFAFRQDGGTPPSTGDIGQLCVDDLKIGTTFKDVGVPALQISATGNDVQVCWCTNAVGYTLECTESLAPTNWMGVAVSELNGKFIANFPDTTSNKFFRLFKP